MQIKHTTLFLLFAGTFAFAQIKTNQIPSFEGTSNAFLDASENTTGQPNNIGRGLLFPQTDLSTFTLDISAADGINYPTYFDGMIVYNTHEGDATTDPSLTTQTENLEKGFYYFSNPTGKDTQSIANGKWVKISDAQASASEWKYNPDNERIELTRSGKGEFKNKVYYTKEGRFINSESQKTYLTTSNEAPYEPITSGLSNAFNIKMLNAKSIPYEFDQKYYGVYASKDILDVDDEGINKITGTKSLANKSFITQTLPDTKVTPYLISGISANAINRSNTLDLENMSGASGNSYIYGGNIKTSMVGVYGSNIIANDGGKVSQAIGVRAFNSIGSKGTSPIVNTASGLLAYNFFRKDSHAEVKNAAALRLWGWFEENAQVNVETLYGTYLDMFEGISKGSSTVKNAYGLYMENIWSAANNYAIYTNAGKVRFGDALNVDAILWTSTEKETEKKNVLTLDLENPGFDGEMKKSIASTWKSKRDNYVGHRIDFGLNNTNQQTDPFMAFGVAIRQKFPSDQDMTIERMRITSTGNIGIGTTTPTEKLEVAGSIKSSDLAGTGIRNIVADANGKLIVGEATSSDETLTIKKTVKVVPNTVDSGNGLADTPAEGKNLRNYNGTSVPNYANSDYMIVLTNPAIAGNLELPSAKANPGRIIYLINGTTRSLGFTDNGEDVTPFNIGSVAVGSGAGFVSTGKTWYIIGR